MHYIRGLFGDGVEDSIHHLFVRYGRGSYLGPVCVVEAGKKLKFSSSVEYCGAFGLVAASTGGDFDVKGSIHSLVDFRDVLGGLGLGYSDKSKEKRGLYVAELSGSIPSEALLGLYGALPYAMVLLSLKGSKAKLKCKGKPPKPGKEKDAEFCSGELDPAALDRLREEVLFDVGDFRSVRVENTYVIEKLVVPEGLDAAEARLQAKRKGKVVRVVVADGVEKRTECPLLV